MPQRIAVRIVELKRGRKLMFQSRLNNRDLISNFDLDDGVNEVERLLSIGFRNAHLFTNEHELQLKIGKRSARLTRGKMAAKPHQSRSHDREKENIVDSTAYYLKALGITDEAGNVKSNQQPKWRQINKFVEIIDGLVRDSNLSKTNHLEVVDIGSGKGYLTFAAYDHLRNRLGLNIRMVGVELRKDLVDLCNQISATGEFGHLSFVQSSASEFDSGKLDILIALHACDTATDDALAKGIRADASIIVAAPCCHKELRKQISAPRAFDGIFRHGVVRERLAEIITDGLRSLILEREGYSTKLFEFVSPDHTPKNNMLVAIKSQGNADKELKTVEIRELAAEFNIKTQSLMASIL